MASFDHFASAVQTEFVDGGPEKRKIFIHRARLTDLKPEARYSKLHNVFQNSDKYSECTAKGTRRHSRTVYPLELEDLRLY